MKSRKIIISESAARLFRKRGYQATSMRDIAKAADIQAASIYNHFKSKQEILNSLLMRMAHLFTQSMQEIKQSSASPLGKLEQLIALHVQLTVEHTDAIALLAGEWIHLEEPHQQEYRQLRNAYESDFKSIIEEGKEKKIFRSLDTELAMFAMLSTLRWLYSWYSKNRNYGQKELEQQMVDSLLNGIKV